MILSPGTRIRIYSREELSKYKGVMFRATGNNWEVFFVDGWHHRIIPDMFPFLGTKQRIECLSSFGYKLISSPFIWEEWMFEVLDINNMITKLEGFL